MLRQKFRNRILSGYGSGVLAETWNGRMLVEAGDFAVGRALLRDGSYDRPAIEWLIKGFGGHAQLVVVVGTHIGALLVPLSRACEEIVGYEPDAKNYALLQTNLLLNQVGNAAVHNVAVGAQAGKACFARNSLNTGNSAITPSSCPEAVEVETVCLDKSLAGKTQSIALMVMDVEGYECEALKGAQQTLARTERLYIEYAPEHLKCHGSSAAQLFSLLKLNFNYLYMLDDAGVRCWDMDAGAQHLNLAARKRHYLANILLTKAPLPDNAAKLN